MNTKLLNFADKIVDESNKVLNTVYAWFFWGKSEY